MFKLAAECSVGETGHFRTASRQARVLLNKSCFDKAVLPSSIVAQARTIMLRYFCDAGRYGVNIRVCTARTHLFPTRNLQLFRLELKKIKLERFNSN